MARLLLSVALLCIALANQASAAPPRLSSSKVATRAYARSSNGRSTSATSSSSSSSSSSRSSSSSSDSKKGRGGTATAASDDAAPPAPANQLQGAVDHLRKTVKRLVDGAQSVPRNYMEADRLKKIRKARGSEALTFKEYKFVEREKEDMSKVFRMLVTIPFSPEFFFYSYIVFPTMGSSNPWAWSAMPSGFDADPEDERKRTDVLQKRRVQAVVKAITTLKGETVEAGGDAKQLAARERQLAMIERALKSSSMRDALKECAPLLMTDSDRRLAPLKMKLRDVPGAIVKDCLRCVGIEGLPNIPLINRLNKGEVAKHFDKVRDSDVFLASVVRAPPPRRQK